MAVKANAMHIFDLSRRGRQSISIGLFLSFALVFIWSWRFAGPDTATVKHRVSNTVMPYAESVIQHISPQSRISTLDLEYLQPYINTETFSYARRTIRTKHHAGDRKSLTRINEPLLGTAHILSKENLSSISITSLPILNLRIPSSPETDPGIMSFGMATEIPRLTSALPQLLHWLPHTNAQVHVIAPPHDLDLQMQNSIRAMGINLTINTSNLPFPKAYFSIVKTLYEARGPKTKWLVLMDDDTFIPSLRYLVSHLERHYDADEEVMIAATSDDIGQVRNFGLIPFGGAGIFISVPLAQSLVQREVWDYCMESGKDQGDQIVNDCLNTQSTVRPTFDLGLHQMDITGDSSGYFESGRRMLTIHHWRSWFNVNVPMAGNVSKACGDECVFQRWLFDENIVLSNGYSVVDYPKGVQEKELEKVEKTWNGDLGSYLHKIGPLRESYQKEEKRQARLVEAVVVEGVGVRQIYVENAEWIEEGAQRIDRVVELLWLF